MAEEFHHFLIAVSGSLWVGASVNTARGAVTLHGSTYAGGAALAGAQGYCNVYFPLFLLSGADSMGARDPAGPETRGHLEMIRLLQEKIEYLQGSLPVHNRAQSVGFILLVGSVISPSSIYILVSPVRNTT